MCVAVCCSVSQWDAVCCSVLQSVAECCSVLQCVAVCCSVIQCVAVCCSVLQWDAVCCRALQCVVVCCSVLQCVAVCCGVLQYILQHTALPPLSPSNTSVHFLFAKFSDPLQVLLQCVAVCCSVLQWEANKIFRSTLSGGMSDPTCVRMPLDTLDLNWPPTATHCKTCNTLQHTATHCNTVLFGAHTAHLCPTRKPGHLRNIHWKGVFAPRFRQTRRRYCTSFSAARGCT